MAKGFSSLISRVGDTLQRRISVELQKMFSEEVIPKISDNLMRAYDETLAIHEPGYDPAKPSVARAAFKESIDKSLKSTLDVVGTSVSLSTGNTADLGYANHSLGYLKSGVPKDPNPLDWLIFYLEGFIGDFYFVTLEDFQKFVAAGLRSADSLDKFRDWGWYGQGFLIPAKTYMAQGFDKAPGVTHKKHPFSGKSKSDIFDRAMEGVDVVALVDLAITRALDNMR